MWQFIYQIYEELRKHTPQTIHDERKNPIKFGELKFYIMFAKGILCEFVIH